MSGRFGKCSAGDGSFITRICSIALFAMVNSSQTGDGVLDPFLGSGSTLVAAERTGRSCYGVELAEHYASVVVARWEAFAGQQATKIS